MSIAINVVDIGIDTARQNEANKINEIVVEIGKLSGVVPDALEFCYQSASKGTIAEGSRLSLIHIPGQAYCENCKTEFETDSMVAACPECGELVFQVQGGRELRVKSINVD